MSDKKYLEMEEISVTDERGRKWYMRLGRLSDLDIKHEDHGLMVLTGTFDFGGSGQGVQCVLDSYHKEKKTRLGTVFASELIRKIIIELGTYSLNETNGLFYAIYDKPHNGFIRGLAHPTDRTRFVIFNDVLEETKGLDWTKDIKEDD